MSALPKTSPFALRDLPTPQEWHNRKVALISGRFFASKTRGRLIFVFAQASPARMDHICSCLDLARVTVIIGCFVHQDRAAAREGLPCAWHHSSLIQFQHLAYQPSLLRPARTCVSLSCPFPFAYADPVREQEGAISSSTTGTYLIAPTSYTSSRRSSHPKFSTSVRNRTSRSPSTWPNIQAMSPPSAPCVFSMLYAHVASRTTCGSTRRRLPSFMGWYSPCHKMRIPHSTRAARMVSQNCMRSGSPKIIVKPTTCSRAMASFSTMRALVVGAPS